MTEAPPVPDHAIGEYTGDGKTLFWLALRTSLLTLLTLGIYRFWAKTRIRRYTWSATRLDGTRFEYTGTGLEKFLGFLMAVVILAVYLGVLQLLLVWFGMTIFADPETPEQAMLQGMGLSVSALAVTPLVFFAQYRARRYRLARTRWRGIRCGMDKAAWGYAFRAMGYWALTLVSLGALLPLMTFRLEKYMTERSWFGDARFEQHGSWTGMYRQMKHLLIGLALVLGGLLTGSIGMATDQPALIIGYAAFAVGLVWFPIGVISWRVQSFAYLTRHKTLGRRVTFDAQPETKTVILAWVVGSIVLAVALSVATGIIGGTVAALLAGSGFAVETGNGDHLFLPIVLAALGYLLTLAATQAGALAAIVQPILKHYVTTLTLHNISALDEIHQRAADPGADAEGFADALDLGGAL
ncbi:DUF898 family protein [Salipiger sp. 1_MG-2023]|uniref:DUF898 family protein n=1 Tax=Salipiger sp. 1_MG-2023 TaxID=3062665 RepID=UPI0026E37970|nr:DUF898 family protein [Salipiger sp. 1_MG-2023]MDO6584192.1 DUF898 family protein [Salipiger sp. 1_MG-2023]